MGDVGVAEGYEPRVGEAMDFQRAPPIVGLAPLALRPGSCWQHRISAMASEEATDGTVSTLLPDEWFRLLASRSRELLSATDRSNVFIGERHRPTEGGVSCRRSK